MQPTTKVLSLLTIALLVASAQAHPQKLSQTMTAPLSSQQKQLQTALWRDLGNLKKPTAAQLKRIEGHLKAGSPVNAPDKSGLLPLMAAVSDERLLALLLKYGATPNLANKDGATALHIAAMMGGPGTAKRLLAAGAQLEARTKSGETPLICAACMMAKLENAHALIEAGANLEARDKSGLTALGNAATLENGRPLICLLLDAGAQINTRDNEGTTPLMTAAMMGRVETVELLLSRGANPNLKDRHGSTALDGAKTLPFLATLGATHEGRQLTREEPKMRARSQRIVQLLTQAKGVTEPAPKWKSSDWQERMDAAQTLGESDNPNAAKTLLILLEDSQWMVREAAMLAIGELWKGCDSLRQSGSKTLVAALIACARSPLGKQKPVLRIDVLDALANIGDSNALSAMRPFLRDSDAETRLFAIHTVARFGDRENLPPLRQIAQTDTATSDGESLREAAQKAIADIESFDKGGTH